MNDTEIKELKAEIADLYISLDMMVAQRKETLGQLQIKLNLLQKETADDRNTES
jgi:hypothetical protein